MHVKKLGVKSECNSTKRCDSTNLKHCIIIIKKKFTLNVNKCCSIFVYRGFPCTITGNYVIIVSKNYTITSPKCCAIIVGKDYPMMFSKDCTMIVSKDYTTTFNQ